MGTWRRPNYHYNSYGYPYYSWNGSNLGRYLLLGLRRLLTAV
jgi:hypothetical protein